MKKIEMFIRPEKLEEVKDILNKANINGLTVTMVSGCGNQKGRKETYRGTQVDVNLLPKIKVESIVHDDQVDAIIDQVVDAIHTGNVGDGKIFVYNVEKAVRIRTNERDDNAL